MPPPPSSPSSYGVDHCAAHIFSMSGKFNYANCIIYPFHWQNQTWISIRLAIRWPFLAFSRAAYVTIAFALSISWHEWKIKVITRDKIRRKRSSTKNATRKNSLTGLAIFISKSIINRIQQGDFASDYLEASPKCQYAAVRSPMPYAERLNKFLINTSPRFRFYAAQH